MNRLLQPFLVSVTVEQEINMCQLAINENHAVTASYTTGATSSTDTKKQPPYWICYTVWNCCIWLLCKCWSNLKRLHVNQHLQYDFTLKPDEVFHDENIPGNCIPRCAGGIKQRYEGSFGRGLAWETCKSLELNLVIQ